MKNFLSALLTRSTHLRDEVLFWLIDFFEPQQKRGTRNSPFGGVGFFALALFLSLIGPPKALRAQTSPTRQATFVVPTTLSSCNKDTICVLVSNMQGGKGITYTGNVTLDIDIPGGTLIPYVSGSVNSFPAGATEVSYAANKLKISVPLPATGATTRVCFVVIPECSIATISGLPSFSGKITYPGGFPTASETFMSSLINVGTPKLSMYNFSNEGAFGGKTQLGYAISNTGYGNIDEVTLYTIVPNALVLDSVAISSSPNYKDASFTPTATMPVVTPYDATHSLYTYKLKGANLGNDGILEVGGYAFLVAFFKAPAACATYDFISWPDYTCKSGTQTACTPPVKIPSKIEISAGTPKLDGTLISAESPDGCPNKHIEYKVKNNGVGNAAPVGNAYDIDLNINFGSGLLSLINLKLNGVAVPAANITPTTGSNNSSFTIKLKDLMTTDPDGAGGISDIDGDGFFDDMLVGAETTVSFDYNIPCNLVCGVNILYDVKSTATFTDFCRTLKGVTTTPLIKFGFRQEQPIEQANTPNYGIVGAGEFVPKNVRYNFKYQQFNMDFTNAVAEIRINYSKKFEIDLSSLKLNGVSVTGTKIGTDTQASASATDPAQTATSNDSTIVITLTPAQVAELFDANGDSLSYTQIYYGCTDRQNTTSADNWQLIMKMKAGLCTDGSTPCGFDLACRKPYAYGSGNSCGGNHPCFITNNDLKRVAPTGYTDITKTTPLLADPGRLYAGDTLQYAINTFIQYDYPLGANGAWLNAYGGNNKGGDLHYQFTFNYSVPKGYQGEYPFLFTEKNSKVVIRQRTPNPADMNQYGTIGAVLFEAPLLLSDFADWNYNPATVNNKGHFDGYPTAPGSGALGCGLYPWDLSYLNCPYEDYYYYGGGGNIVAGRQFNVAQDKVTDVSTIWVGSALARAGWFGDVGDDNYFIEVQTKWVVNPKFPWDNTNSFSTRATSGHYGNGTTQNVIRCNIPAASALAVTKDYYIPNPRATYKPECSLRISNKIDFKSYSGNYFQNGEVRVPFTVDKIVATIPSEYAFAATPNITLDYNQSCSAQTTTAITASATSGTVTFTNTAGGDFPRVDDCAGLTTAYNLSYTLAKVGTAAPSNYKMPIQIFTKDEWGAVVILYDTLTIAEANPVLTLSPLNSVVKIDDGGACSTSFVDYVIQNNTLFAAPNTYFAVKSSAATTVTDITDGGNVYGDPIIAGDIATYGTNDKIVKIGTLGAGDKRIVRIFFQTSVCADQLDVYTDFGCSYPSPFEPNLASTTLKTAKLDFSATDPVIISRPNAAVTVANLCDNKTLYIQINNTTNANVYKMLAGLKFPAGISYVAGTAQLYNNVNGSWNNVPAGDITSPSTDSLAINLANSAPFNTACGLEGPDKSNGLGWVKFDIAFTACPPANVASILYKVQAENFCGTKTNSMGVFPVNFVGTGSQNNYTLSSKADPIKLCAATNVALPVTDNLYIKNIGGYGTASGASSGKDSVTITLQFNPAEFTLTALTIGAPFSSPVFGTDTQGKPTVRLLIPAGIAVGDSLAMPLTYTITPLKDKLCTVASTPPLCFFGLFRSPLLLECAAKNLTCAAGGVALRGSGLSLRAFDCCFGSIGDYVWKDTNKDGKQDVGEVGVNGIEVVLWSATGTGTPVAKLDSTVTANGGKYLFDTLTKGDYVVQFVKSSIPAECSGFTAKDTIGVAGINDANDSDADKITGITAKVSLDPVVLDSTSTAADSLKTNNFTIDAGLIALFGSLGDFVWKDTNNNGIQDETTPNGGGVAGVQIELYKNGTLFAKDTTDATGKYLFSNLDAGTYKIKVLSASIPAGCEISAVKDAPNDDAKDSDVDKTTGESGNYVIDPLDPTKKDILTVDAALFTPKGSLGDFVWKDTNNNGIQDETTPNAGGVAGVQIELYKNGTLFAKDTTDATGKYLFSNLDAGTYKIKVLSASIPAGCEISAVKDAPSDDAKDSDVDKTTGESGNYVIDPLDPTKKDILTVDAGLAVPCVKSNVTLTGAPVCSADVQTYSLNFSVTNKVGIVKVDKGTLTGSNPYTVTGIPSGATVKITDSLSAVCKWDTLITGPNCNCNPPTPVLITPSLTVCIGDTFPTIKATVIGLATVEWFATATSTTVLFTGLNYKPTGNVTAAGAMFYAQARSTDPSCPTAISTSRVMVTINAQNCTVEVDLALKKLINKKIAQIGDELTYTIKVFNQLNVAATGVEVTDSIATNVEFVVGSFAASRGSASISGNVITWTIGGIGANAGADGDTVTLTYKVKATQEGVHFNTAEISKTNEKDIDSTPGNGKDGEDDIESQCFTVPIKLCPGEKAEANVPAFLTNVQWFKNGGNTAIAAGNAVLLTEVGTYTFTATNQACPANGCCPIIIEPGVNCCPDDLCIPFTIKKTKKK